jgi:hypothetical protein
MEFVFSGNLFGASQRTGDVLIMSDTTSVANA